MNISFKKSQAAMEFLMTYGWAILVVLVAIGALAYFGVLSPDRFLPAKCQLPSGIACTDFKVEAGATPTTGTVDIVLRNGIGFDMGSVDATDDFRVAVSGCTGDYVVITDTIELSNGQQKTFQITACTISAGSKFNGELNVSYVNKDTNLPHKIQGVITGRVE